MSQYEVNIDVNFHEYADLQLRRHNLLIEGEDEGAKLDAIEDQMTELWDKLDAIQRQNLNAMGSDLNWIRRKGESPPNGRKPEEVTAAERQELIEARDRKDWHRLLHLARICASTIPAVNLVYLRGEAYKALGFPNYSAAFHEFAAELEPANPLVGVIALKSLDRFDAKKAHRRAEQVIASPLRFPSAVVAMSVVIMLEDDNKQGRPLEIERYSKILHEAVDRVRIEPPSDVVQAMTFQLSALAFEILGESDAALRCFEEGLRRAPENEVMLIGQGLLLYGTLTGRAVEAFLQVVNAKETSAVWPYFFLAHHYLVQRNYGESLKMGLQAMPRASTNPLRAELYQWQAICLRESGYPPEMIRSLFEKALALDPSNDRIRRNAAIVQTPIADEQQTMWDIETEEILRNQTSANLIDIELVA